MTNNLHHWNGSGDPQEFVDFMQNAGFVVIFQGNGEIVFFNRSFEKEVREDKLDYTTLGL